MSLPVVIDSLPPVMPVPQSQPPPLQLRPRRYSRRLSGLPPLPESSPQKMFSQDLNVTERDFKRLSGYNRPNANVPLLPASIRNRRQSFGGLSRLQPVHELHSEKKDLNLRQRTRRQSMAAISFTDLEEPRAVAAVRAQSLDVPKGDARKRRRQTMAPLKVQLSEPCSPARGTVIRFGDASPRDLRASEAHRKTLRPLNLDLPRPKRLVRSPSRSPVRFPHAMSPRAKSPPRARRAVRATARSAARSAARAQPRRVCKPRKMCEPAELPHYAQPTLSSRYRKS